MSGMLRLPNNPGRTVVSGRGVRMSRDTLSQITYMVAVACLRTLVRVAAFERAWQSWDSYVQCYVLSCYCHTSRRYPFRQVRRRHLFQLNRRCLRRMVLMYTR